MWAPTPLNLYPQQANLESARVSENHLYIKEWEGTLLAQNEISTQTGLELYLLQTLKSNMISAGQNISLKSYANIQSCLTLSHPQSPWKEAGESSTKYIFHVP